MRYPADKFAAGFKQGALELCIPKAEHVQPRRIELKIG
jgi:hypothetical protein